MNLWLRVLAALGVTILAATGCQKGNQAGSTKAVASKETKGAAGVRAGSKAAEHTAVSGGESREEGTARDRSRAVGGVSTLTEVDNGRVLNLRQGQTLAIVLDSNRSSGLSWVLVHSKMNVVERDGTPAYVPPSGKRENGTETWRFRAVRPGEQTVRLDYRREWAQSVPERTFHFTAVVR